MKCRIEGRFWKNEKTFPGLNDYIHELGRNPKSGSHMKRKYEKIASDALRAVSRRKKYMGRVTHHFRFEEPSKDQKRVHMNVFSFANKVIEDALQKCGVIPDDSPVFVVGSRITHEFLYTDGTPWIEVEIEEVK